MKVKHPIDAKPWKGTVYKVTGAHCPATYFGETGCTLDCRTKEYTRSAEKQDVVNRIGVHNMDTKHRIDWGELLVWNLMLLRIRDCFWKVYSRNAMKTVSTFASIYQEHALD